MNPFDVAAALKTMTVLVDTREQDTERARARLRRIGVPVEREKLDCGDYSVKCSALSLKGMVAIERKMNLNELSQCFCQGRKRFEREFERARKAGTKIYLLIENASLDAAYRHQYQTKMDSRAMVASIFAWLARYNCQVLFCSDLTSGQVIHDVLYRELKESLEQMPDEEVKEDAEAGVD